MLKFLNIAFMPFCVSMTILFLLIILSKTCSSKTNPLEDIEYNKIHLKEDEAQRDKLPLWEKEDDVKINYSKSQDAYVKETQRKKDESLFFLKTKGLGFIFKWEKKTCSAHKLDRGGVTCWGLSYRSHKKKIIKLMNGYFTNCRYSHNGLICKDIDPPGIIREVYFNNYFIPWLLCGKKRALALADRSVLSGIRNTTKILQRASNIKIDGVLGPQSRAACRDVPLRKLKLAEMSYLRQIILNDPTQEVFLRGWTNRVNAKYKMLKDLK